MKNRPFLLSSILCILVALCAIAVMSNATSKAGVQKPEGFRSPILALEFAQGNSMIDSVFQLSATDTTIAYRQALHSKVQWFKKSVDFDYLFILAYGSFMLFFAWGCKRLGQRRYALALAFALLAIIADGMENGYLKEIFSLIDARESDFSTIFPSLHFWTCLKFFSTGAYFIALSSFFWKAHWLGKVVVMAASLSLVFWALALKQPKQNADLLFSMIFLAFAGAMIFGLLYKKQSKELAA